MPRFSNIQDLISPATLRRIAHYAEVVHKDPRTIIDRELNNFLDERGDYTMQQLAMMDRSNTLESDSNLIVFPAGGEKG